MSLADFRREYNLAGLQRGDLDTDPTAQFRQWLDQAAGARRSGRLRKFFVSLYKSLLTFAGSPAVDATAMTLATADKEGRPSARIVLLKGVDERGFIFFTNYHSRKAQELTENPHAALVFYWPDLERQISIAGRISRVSPEESAAYFRTRPRGSQLAAWASDQSEVLKERAMLEDKWKLMEAKYSEEEVPCPPHWGGYVLAPTRIEFWQGRPNRMHDRFRYTKQADGGWQIERLSP